MKIGNVSISTDNSKMGIIPSVSLPAIKTCIPNPPCKDICYGIKLCKRYKNARKAYQDNLNCLLSNSLEFFNNINNYLTCFRPRFIRIHVVGDFNISKDQKVNQDYLNSWSLLADNNPDTRFLAFTKCYYLDYSNIPDNFRIIWSAWPNYEMPQLQLTVKGIAWMRDKRGLETRIPDDAIPCSGKCDSCFLCWNLDKQSVVFDQH